MKHSFQIAAVAAFAGLVNAQSTCLPLVTGIPPCALGYIASIAYNLPASCDIDDFKCQCDNITPIANALATDLMPFDTDCVVGSAYQGATPLCSCATANSDQPALTLSPQAKSCEPLALSIPPCALGFIASEGVNQGCQFDDLTCLCGKYNNIQLAVVNSVNKYCGSASVGLDTVISAANSFCACQTGPFSGDSGSASPTGSSPSANPTGSTTGTGSPTGSGSPAPSGSATSGPSATGTGPSATGSSSKAPSGSVSGSASVPIQSGKTTAKTPSIPTFSGAGATMSAFGGVVGVVAGLAALL